MRCRSSFRRHLHSGLGAAAAVLGGLCLWLLPAQADSVHELTPEEYEGSSVLPVSAYGDYWVRNVGDHNLSTAWVEGVSGYGYGEYIDLYIPAGTVVTGVVIYPGYLKSEDLFWKNAAPTALTVSSSGETNELSFYDAASSFTAAYAGVELTFQTPLTSDGIIRFTVTDVRGGNTYTDTCISELHLMGYTPDLSGVVVDGGGADAAQTKDDGITFEHIYENGYERAVIRAHDEEQRVIWTVNTPSYSLAQCDRVGEIGLHDGKYYYADDCYVVTLDPADGSVIWKSDVSVGSHPTEAFDFDEDGNLYISGYLGPDLTILSPDGKTLGQFDTLKEGYYWPYVVEVEEKGHVLITYEMVGSSGDQEGQLRVDVSGWVTGASSAS